MNRLRIALNSIRRESANGRLYAAAWFLRRFHLRFIRRGWNGLPSETPEDRARPITIVIPAVEKDAPALERCLDAARRHVVNPIDDLLVVAPESALLRSLAERAGGRLVHEDGVLPRPARVLRTRGWVLQQLIKFNAAGIVRTPDYLVLDADTVFLRPQCFYRGGRAVLRYSDQYELLYNRSLALVFGHTRRFPASFVTHHQLFRAAHVRDLLAFMEQRFGCAWWEAILREVDQGHPISFSEYELYGHFIMDDPARRRGVALQYWHGMDRTSGELSDLPRIEREAGGRVNSVSFHWHTQ